jgi:hypothetical protein
MDEPRPRDRLLFALACYASVLAWVALIVTGAWLGGPQAGCLGSVEAKVVLGVFLTLPIPGMLIGLGTGALLSRGGYGARGAIIGFALGILVVGATLAAWR